MKVKEKVDSVELDNEIVNAIQNGTQAEKDLAFSKLFKKYKNGIFFNLNKALFFDEETAKDLMMDVFIKIHSSFNSYKPNEGALSTWIYKITKNTLIDYKRREKYEVFRIDNLAVKNSDDNESQNAVFQIEDKSINNNAIDLIIKEERASSIKEAIRSIKKEKVRTAITLFYFFGFSYAEICVKMNEPESNVKAFIFRGKKELKVVLDKKGFNF